MSAVNISEGRNGPALTAIGSAAGGSLLDVHRDEHHNRSVLTLVGVEAVHRVVVEAVARIDLRRHSGVHPRLGAVDVVPFVPFGETTMPEARAARDSFVLWAMHEVALPAIVYDDEGPTLPEVRRWARLRLLPHPTAGAVCVAARAPLVAFNVWLASDDLSVARRAASAVRSPTVRALGLPVGERVQVSMNLIDPLRVGPAAAYDAVAAETAVTGAELVGLVPDAVLQAVPRPRWDELDLGEDRTVEVRLKRSS